MTSSFLRRFSRNLNLNWRGAVCVVLAGCESAAFPPEPGGPEIPTAVVSGAETLSAGPGHTCGVTTAGSLICWGSNSFGQLGDGTTESKDLPTPVRSHLIFSSVSVGQSHTCAITETGEAYCWGYNYRGELGDGSTSVRTEPTRVAGDLKFTEVASEGSFGTCGLSVSGHAYCWGQGTLTPTRAPHEGRFVALAVGGDKGCGLTAGGEKHCWTLPSQIAERAGGLWRALAGGGSYACGCTPSGYCYCSGTRTFCGVTARGEVDCWANEEMTQRFSSVSVGFEHQCAVTAAGAAYCFGGNRNGQLGTGSSSDAPYPLDPVLVRGGIAFVRASAGTYHTCGLTRSGVVYCWGDNGLSGNGREPRWGISEPAAIGGTLRLRLPPTGTVTQALTPP